MPYLLVAFGLMLMAVAGLMFFTPWTARRVGAALPPPGRFVEIGGSRIHYLDRGGGPTLLLIHGSSAACAPSHTPSSNASSASTASS